ncbi:CamS family sex pheromone protein [Niallia taxi]|uniref:CamS family sex pheromone protein n=1 Tax=Niallia taxi TaxID=2499688 RepID=A0A437KG52_9BACI|nr:CamS family sex pheromone protein [Niallia taxi]MCM3214924.1 CamS family sex pheromone protein [Niallia taxi]MDK8638826.1 CamS family sex pheromone protein [Niallia taxi]MED4037635.1 CamS family sex pheromone protein [Niallia taxi]MED4053552.1 CamS family sex pheromone protein [Niallia taxi]MED4119392.1 CamS family sex pheromone protein [Niallia taxi]
MKYKKIIMMGTIFMTILAACDKDTDNGGTEEAVPTTIIQNKEIYRIAEPVKVSAARGAIVNNVDNTVDIKELEMGLMDLSTDYFPTDNYYLQEGQYLDSATISSWIARKSKDQKDGLNPTLTETGDILKDEKKNPKILSHVLEQDYVNSKGKIQGISLAVSLNEIYYIRATDEKGLVYTDEVAVDTTDNGKNEVEEQGKSIAETILKRIRANSDIPDVPIYLTLYQETNKGNIVPGKFLASSYIDKNDNTIGKWKEIKRNYIAFPSSSFESLDRSLSNVLSTLEEDIQEQFKELNIIMTGKLLYNEEELSNITLNIEAPNITSSETTALIEYVGGKIESQILPDYLPITVQLSGTNEAAKAIMIWDPSEKEIKTEIYE